LNKLDVVIGSSWGDEGKGLTVARIAKKYNPFHTVEILNNGGAQRGHSVDYGTVEHVFKHFGSATPLGITTFFGDKFILNPMQFGVEYNEIMEKFGKFPTTARSKNCMFSTPYDMMANQMLQQQNWTGSCGMGIWETILRNSFAFSCLPFEDFIRLNFEEKVIYLKLVRDYFEKNRKIEISSKYKKSWYSEDVIYHFIFDCDYLASKSKLITNQEEFIKSFDNVIVENGQGLLLGDTGKDDKDATPSKTGVEAIPNYLLEDKQKVNIHYITRPYLTRHGANEWTGETPVKIDNSVEINQYNEWQGEFLYAPLSINELKQRCDEDIKKIGMSNYTMEITHCDEMDREKDFKSVFSNCNFYDIKRL